MFNIREFNRFDQRVYKTGVYVNRQLEMDFSGRLANMFTFYSLEDDPFRANISTRKDLALIAEKAVRFAVVDDVMKSRGIQFNPWEVLFKISLGGFHPQGVRDKDFLITLYGQEVKEDNPRERFRKRIVKRPE